VARILLGIELGLWFRVSDRFRFMVRVLSFFADATKGLQTFRGT